MAVNVLDYVGIGIDPKTGRRHEIKFLPKVADWEEAIYQFEQKDKLIGGIDGIDNVQAQMLANRTEYLKQLIEEKSSGAAVTFEVSIPATGWSNNLGGYPYQVDIPIDSITADMVPMLSISPAFMEEAGACGLCPVCETINGGLRIYAKAVPDAAITASLTVFAPGGGGGYGVLPIATESALGTVKIGEGLTVQMDGTLSVNKEKVMTDSDLVNEEEVMEDVERILHDD